MSLVDNLFDRHVVENRHCAEAERHHLAVQQCKELLALARELEAHCEAMLGMSECVPCPVDCSCAACNYRKWRQERK